MPESATLDLDLTTLSPEKRSALQIMRALEENNYDVTTDLRERLTALFESLPEDHKKKSWLQCALNRHELGNSRGPEFRNGMSDIVYG
ncbi:MAG: hypothetical protein ABL890_00150 [Candidatus Peribacteraceae bacterium]